MSKQVKQAKKKIQEKIAQLEKRIMRQEDEAEKIKQRINSLYKLSESETSELEKNKILQLINDYRIEMNYFIRKADKLGERQEGLEIALKILG